MCVRVEAHGYRGEIERRLALLVLHGGVGAVGQQQSAQLGPSLLRRLVQRGEGPLVRGVHTRVVLDQQRRDVHVLQGTRPGGHARHHPQHYGALGTYCST